MNVLHFFCLLFTGVSETVVLNMSTLVWSVVFSVEGRVPLASEVLYEIIYYLYAIILESCTGFIRMLIVG